MEDDCLTPQSTVQALHCVRLTGQGQRRGRLLGNFAFLEVLRVRISFGLMLSSKGFEPWSPDWSHCG